MQERSRAARIAGPKVHGAPPRLASLLLDGNATSDEGAIEVISFIEAVLQRGVGSGGRGGLKKPAIGQDIPLEN